MTAKLLSRMGSYGLSLVLAIPIGMPAQQERTEGSTSQSDALPPEARYGILFRRLTSPTPQNQASEMSGTREGPPNYREVLQRSADLSDEEAQALNQIANDCVKKVAEFDKRAREILVAHRAENRSRNGATGDPSPPPAELSQLQQDRNNVILQAVEQLRVAFGDAEFKRFDEYVKNKGGGRRFVLPAANKKPLPIQVTITLLDHDGATSRRQFAPSEKVIIQVAMLNKSTQMVAVKQSEVYDWLQLIQPVKDQPDRELTGHRTIANCYNCHFQIPSR